MLSTDFSLTLVNLKTNSTNSSPTVSLQSTSSLINQKECIANENTLLVVINNYKTLDTTFFSLKNEGKKERGNNHLASTVCALQHKMNHLYSQYAILW